MTEAKATSFEDLGIKVKPNLREFNTTCPNCSHLRKKENQKKECLKVWNYEHKKTWNCIHCGWSGGLNVYERYKEVYKASRMPKELKPFFSKPVTDWLESRGISVKTALFCRCYETQDNLRLPELAFPYYFQNTLRNVMFRRLDKRQAEEISKTYQITKDKGTDTIFWGLDDLDFTQETGEDYVIITEGQPDRMSWIEAGYKNILSIPSGAPNPNTKVLDKKMEFINEDFRRLIREGQQVRGRQFRFYIDADADASGMFLQKVLGEMLGKQRCWNIEKPQGYKDTNEVWAGDESKGLRKLGKEALDTMFQEARPSKLYGVINLYDVKAEILHIAEHGHEKGLITGIPQIDDYISIKRKILCVITGIPSMGKSTWGRYWWTELARKNDINWGMYTPENRPVSREYSKIVEVFSKQYLNNKYYPAQSMTTHQRDKAFDWCNSHFTIINPERKYYEKFDDKDAKPKTLKNILNYFKTLKETHGIYGFIIDAWNKVDHERPSGVTETDHISRQLDMVLEFLDVNDLCGMIVAHPAKQERQRGGNFEVPTMYDIKGSSAWYEKVDIGISIHRTKFINLNQGVRGAQENWVLNKNASTEVHVQKMKFEELGQEQKIDCWMDWKRGNTFIYENPNKQVEIKTETTSSTETEPELPFF
jgi:twinkle protein